MYWLILGFVYKHDFGIGVVVLAFRCLWTLRLSLQDKAGGLPHVLTQSTDLSLFHLGNHLSEQIRVNTI